MTSEYLARGTPPYPVPCLIHNIVATRLDSGDTVHLVRVGQSFLRFEQHSLATLQSCLFSKKRLGLVRVWS